MILVFGTICLDRVLRVPRLPQLGGYVEIEDETVYLGGEAANTANALHFWGAEIVLAGNSAGAGHEAERIRRLLSEAGLQNVMGDLPSHRTPVCEIFVTPDGERTMFGHGFATMDQGFPVDKVPVRANEWFTADPNMGKAARESARRAASSGMKLYLMDFLKEDDPIGPGSFWQSSTDWMGVRGNIQKNVRLIDDWVARYGCFAILSDGPNGFVAGGPESPVRHYPPFPAPQIVDTTGAGDLFRAGMLFGLDAGWSVDRCLAYAAAAGSLACRSFGATSSVPTRTEIEGLISEHSRIADHYRAAVQR